MSKEKDMLNQYIEMLGDKNIEIIEVLLENTTVTFHKNGKYFKASNGEKIMSIKMVNKQEMAEFLEMKLKLGGL